jgi:hypothetical protein
MLLLLMDEDSQIYETIVLSASENHVRVAVSDSPDAVEIRYDRGEWRADLSRPARMHALLMDGASDEDFCHCWLAIHAAGDSTRDDRSTEAIGSC